MKIKNDFKCQQIKLLIFRDTTIAKKEEEKKTSLFSINKQQFLHQKLLNN